MAEPRRLRVLDPPRERRRTNWAVVCVAVGLLVLWGLIVLAVLRVAA